MCVRDHIRMDVRSEQGSDNQENRPEHRQQGSKYCRKFVAGCCVCLAGHRLWISTSVVSAGVLGVDVVINL